MLTMRFDRLALPPGSRVLDVGCGGGRHIRQTRYLSGVTSVALDLGKQEVEDTRKALLELDTLLPEHGGAIPEAGPWGVMRGSVYELPFESGAFDCVIISEVLEHLDDDDAALRELSRVLRPGGTLAVSVPRRGPEAVCWALSWKYRNSPGGHVRIYSRTALRQKIAGHGYEVRGSHFAHALHAPFWWLKCLIGLDNENAWPVRTYHRLLVWDLMQRPKLTRWIERALDPLIGKSVVFYAVKES